MAVNNAPPSPDVRKLFKKQEQLEERIAFIEAKLGILKRDSEIIKELERSTEGLHE